MISSKGLDIIKEAEILKYKQIQLKFTVWELHTGIQHFSLHWQDTEYKNRVKAIKEIKYYCETL